MYIPGQRWSSDTEPELGLGVVCMADERQVSVEFPAAGENRCYAVGSAPLHRVLFHPGETIKHRDGQSYSVDMVVERDGLQVYCCGDFEISESALADGQHRDQPLDRLWSGRVSGPDTFELRKAAAEWSHRLQAHPAYGFSGGKVQLIPHQFYIAGEVSGRAAPRVLLCDEVGLGKTIEALLILHRLWVSGKVKRVLILVPDALVHQWFVELFRRFNIRTRIIDDEHVEEHIDDSNVFDLESIVLCGIEWLSRQQAVGLAAVEAQWDLLIVDEAHHLQWSPEAVGPKYRLVEALCVHVPGLILLTATPEQLGRQSHFARLRLLDPHRYHDLDAFMSESHAYRETAERAAALDLAGKESELTELLDRHGPGRVVFRNTRAAIAGFPGRKAHLVSLKAGKNACEKWLAGFLRDHPTSKVVLICTTRESVVRIDERLKRMVQVPTAVFHEGLTLLQRDRSAAWFAEEDGARLLLCSEIGGEGRNFQSAHDLVLYDLPLNPEAIEQRIGRLDRIGQSQTVHVWVPYVEESGEEIVARWFHEGLNAFEQFLAGGNETYAPLLEDLEKARKDPRRVEELIQKSAQHRTEVARALEEGRDRLMELHSYRPEAAKTLLAAIEQQDSDEAYEAFVLKLFELLGAYAEQTNPRTYLVKTNGLVSDAIKGLREERQPVTFDRQVALARDDTAFLAPDHPAVVSALDYVLTGSRGICSVGIWRDEDAQGIYAECLFRVFSTADVALEIDHFLKQTLFHTLVDMQGHDARDLIPVLQAQTLVDARKVGLVDRIQAMKTEVESMVSASGELIQEQFETTIQIAIDEAGRHYAAELSRLNYLKTFNDHIREDEIDELESLRDRTLAAIRDSQLRLDAIRIVVRSSAWL